MANVQYGTNNKNVTKISKLSKKVRFIIFVAVLAGIGTIALLFSRAAELDISTGSQLTCRNFVSNVTITRGGTYTGKCWQTVDGVTPAVKIATTEPVIIEKSIIRGNFKLVEDSVAGVNLTIKDSRLRGLEPKNSVKSRRAVRLSQNAKYLKVENNYIETTSGIKITGWASVPANTSETIVIKNNKVSNITNQFITAKKEQCSSSLASLALTSIGTAAEDTDITSDSTGNSGDHLVQFVQIGKVNALPGVEIAWNEVINEFGKSRVEDNINLYQTGGVGDTAPQRIRIHNNFIWGAYPLKLNDACYRGGGIIAGDTNWDLKIGYVDIYNNQVVGTTNYGVSIACGKHNNAYNNIVVSSGKTPDGDTIPQANVGLSGNNAIAWNGRCAQLNYYNNEFKNNVVGWMNGKNKRNDATFRCDELNSKGEKIRCARNINNASLTANASEPITYEMERTQYENWLAKLSTNSVYIGIRPQL